MVTLGVLGTRPCTAIKKFKEKREDRPALPCPSEPRRLRRHSAAWPCGSPAARTCRGSLELTADPAPPAPMPKREAALSESPSP